MKTAELMPPLLDYWVAKSEELRFPFITRDGDCYFVRKCGPYFEGAPYTPSRDWAHGGPIIDRENIAICRMHGYFGGDDKEYKWTAAVDGSFSYNNDFEGTASAEGSRPLEAAMRAYVASKYGDEVPDIV